MKFKVGDVCLTQNSRVPLLNDKQLVVIVRIQPDLKSSTGESTPYIISRLDGQPHPFTTDICNGQMLWFKWLTARCPERMLRKPKKGDLKTKIVIAKVKSGSKKATKKVTEGAPA